MKIFQLCIEKTVAAFLHAHGFSVIGEDDVRSLDDLYDWLVDGLFDAAVLDLDKADWSVYAARYLRAKGVLTPIVGIVAPDPETTWAEQRSIFLESGGDDLLKNPANPRELAATMRAVARRGRGLTLDVREFKSGGAIVRINLSLNTVSVNGAHVHLTLKEAMILMMLASHRGRVQSKEMLLTNMYTAVDDEPEIKIIDVFVCKIRKKLDDVHPDAGRIIETVWGRGYQIVDESVLAQKQEAEAA